MKAGRGDDAPRAASEIRARALRRRDPLLASAALAAGEERRFAHAWRETALARRLAPGEGEHSSPLTPPPPLTSPAAVRSRPRQQPTHTPRVRTLTLRPPADSQRAPPATHTVTAAAIDGSQRHSPCTHTAPVPRRTLPRLRPSAGIHLVERRRSATPDRPREPPIRTPDTDSRPHRPALERTGRRTQGTSAAHHPLHPQPPKPPAATRPTSHAVSRRLPTTASPSTGRPAGRRAPIGSRPPPR